MAKLEAMLMTRERPWRVQVRITKSKIEMEELRVVQEQRYRTILAYEAEIQLATQELWQENDGLKQAESESESTFAALRMDEAAVENTQTIEQELDAAREALLNSQRWSLDEELELEQKLDAEMWAQDRYYEEKEQQGRSRSPPAAWDWGSSSSSSWWQDDKWWDDDSSRNRTRRGPRGGLNNPNVSWHTAFWKAQREGWGDQFRRENPKPERRN